MESLLSSRLDHCYARACAEPLPHEVVELLAGELAALVVVLHPRSLCPLRAMGGLRV